LEHVLSAGSHIILELFVFSKELLDFLLKSLRVLNGIVLLVVEVTLLVVPFSLFLFEVKEYLSLLGLNTCAFAFSLSELLLVSLLLFV